MWKRCEGGVVFGKEYLLGVGMIVYGLGVRLWEIGDVGMSGMMIEVLRVWSRLVVGCLVGEKVFGVDKERRWLMGGGRSMCGGGGVVGSEGVVKGEGSKVRVGVGRVVMLGRVGILV